MKHSICVAIAPVLLLLSGTDETHAAKLTVELDDWRGVTAVGALERWGADGNRRRAVDPKAKIDAPPVDFSAVAAGNNRWVFDDLPRGKYDLLIMAEGRVRIEGFSYAPVLALDPFFPPDATTDERTAKLITSDIKKSPCVLLELH